MLPVGAIAYTLGSLPVTGTGFSWMADETNEALTGPVAEVVYDDSGSREVEALLTGIAETGFEQKNVREALDRPPSLDDWRVGETLAECYLTDHWQCHFPWPDGRDVRKAGSSLPGADLVGFQTENATARFAFGEVKTSHEAKYPPGAVHGRTGLKQQLEDLRDDVGIRDQLVLYLAHRAVQNPPWCEQFKWAAGRYFKDKQDVRIFGILVRDVPPYEDDLRVRTSKLGQGCPHPMTIELLAIYLPPDSIATLTRTVTRSRTGGDS